MALRLSLTTDGGRHRIPATLGYEGNMAKFTVAIDPEQCKGCHLCIHFCKHRILAAAPEVNRRGYHCVTAAHPEACRGCLNCFLVCPDMAVTIRTKE